MRYMDLEVTHISSKGIDRYRHKYKSFYEKFIFPKSINKGRTTIIRMLIRA